MVCPLSRGFRHWDTEELGRVADAQSFRYAPAAIHGVHQIGVGNRNDVRVAERSPFPRRPETYPTWRARGECHEAASQQSLQVYDEIESLASQQGTELEIVTKSDQRTALGGSTIERQRRIQIGMTVQQRLVSLIDDPGDMRCRIAHAECG